MIYRYAVLLVCMCFVLSCHEKEKTEGVSSPSHEGVVVKKFQKVPKAQRVLGRYEHEFEMTMDGATGEIPKNRFAGPIKALKQKEKQAASQRTAIPGIQWTERGPNNIAGRTRAVMMDPNDNTNKKLWAGSVGGGLWYCNDITSANITWDRVDDFWDNLAISAIAHDPSNTNIFYVGTGEAYGNADAIGGDGIWKTTDGGATWNQLANTTSWSNVTEIIVLDDGTVLVGTRSRLRRSTDGGSSWTIPTQEDVASMSLDGGDNIYIGNFNGDVLRSIDDGATWATILSDDAGRRVEVAAAPSAANTLYALCYKSNSAERNQDIHYFKKTVDGGTIWTDLSIPGYPGCNPNPAVHFTRSQGWYDLTMIVHPTNADRLVVGGVDCHASSDGGATWSAISNWYNCSNVDYVHADIHTFIQRTGEDNSLIVGCDGGVFYSPNIFPTSGAPNFEFISTDYNVTQFYHGDINPTAGLDYLLAGAQDNGTQRIDQAGIDDTDQVNGGDGAYTHIDDDEPNIQIAAYVYNDYTISRNGFTGGGSTSLTIGNSLGRFINPTDYDSHMNTLYGIAGSNQYSWVKEIGKPSVLSGTTNIDGLGGSGDCIKVSPNVTDRIYMANGPNVLTIDNARSDVPVVNAISLLDPQGATLVPTWAYASDLTVELGNEDHIIITFSNFGVNSIWESTDGGQNWQSIEGNLPNMPVRSVVINPNNSDQVLIGTELGVWSTDNINGSNTDWDPTNSGLANVRTDMIRYRQSDNELMAATHGRGVYTTSSLNCGDASGCYPATCRIGDVSLQGDIACDSGTDMYTATLNIELFNVPATGVLNINGTDYAVNNGAVTQNISIELSGAADGQAVNLDISFSATDCRVLRYNVFTAPTPGCGSGLTCGRAINISQTGSYAIPNIITGNGCNNCSSSTHAFWYTFTPSCDGTVTIASCDEGVDTRFYLYSSSGSCNSLNQIAFNDDVCSMGPGLNNYASSVENVQVVAGTKYYIEWDDRWSGAGFDMAFTLDRPSIIHVNENATGANTGCSWAAAYTDLQDAIADMEQNNGIEEIWVAQGTYLPGTDRFSTFLIDNGLKIYGGFDGTETMRDQRNFTANETRLSGNIGSSASSDNAYTVLTINETSSEGQSQTVVDGFKILEGQADGVQYPKSGAGLVAYGPATIANCIITDCFSLEGGAAIYAQNYDTTLLLENVTLENNVSEDGSSTVLIDQQCNIEVKGIVTLD